MLAEEFFKDKINWRFYNFILNRLTIYEDRGLNTFIDIHVDTMTVYSYNKGEQKYLIHQVSDTNNTKNEDIEFLIYISRIREMDELIAYIKNKRPDINIEIHSDKMIAIKNF